MEIKLNIAIYAGVMLALLIWFFVDLFTARYGGMFWSGKKSGEMSLIGGLIILIAFFFTLIWGGIFWW